MFLTDSQPGYMYVLKILVNLSLNFLTEKCFSKKKERVHFKIPLLTHENVLHISDLKLSHATNKQNANLCCYMYQLSQLPY